MDLFQFLYILGMIVFVFAIVLAVGYWIHNYTLKNSIPVKGIVDTKNAVTKVSTIDYTGSWGKPSDLYAYAENRYKLQEPPVENYGVYQSTQDLCYGLFYGLLQNKFHEVNRIGLVEKDPNIVKKKIIIFELVNIVGTKKHYAFLRLETEIEEVKNYQKNLKKIEKFAFEGQIEVITELNFVYPDPSKQFSIKRDNIETAVREAAIEFAFAKEDSDSRIFTLVPGKFGGWNLKGENINNNWTLRKEELQSNYTGITIFRKGDWFPIQNIDTAISIILKTIKQGHTVGFLGKAGTGKTRLFEHIVFLLGQATDTRIVFSTENTINKIMNEEGNITDALDPKVVNILAIEEADSLLQDNPGVFKLLTDSSLNKKMSVSLLFTSNMSLAQIKDKQESGVLRPGRAMLFYLEELEREDATKVADRLKKDAPLEKKIFDNSYYDTYGKQNPQNLGAIYDGYYLNPEVAQLEGLVAEILESKDNPEIIKHIPVDNKVKGTPPVIEKRGERKVITLRTRGR